MNVYDRSGKLVIKDYEKKTANIAENSKAAKARADAMSAQWEQERARREAEKQQEKARKEAEARARKEAAEREKVRKATEEFNRRAQEAAKAQQEEQRRQQAKQNMQSIPALKRVDTVNGFNMPSIQQDNTALNQGPISLPTIDPDAKNRIIPRDVNVRENSLPVALQNNYKIATETDLDKQIQSYLSAGKLTKEQKKEAKNVLKQEKQRRKELFASGNTDAMIPGTDEYQRNKNFDDLTAKVNSNFGYGLVSPFAKISDLALKGIEKLTGTEDSQGAEVMNQQMRDFYNRDKLAAEQAPIAHGVGNFVGQAGIYSATNPLFDAGAEAVGVTSNLGKFAVNQLAQNAQDLALDTAPTYNQNISMGMSEDEAKKEALKGAIFNAGGNLLLGGAGELAGRVLPKLKANNGADAVNQIDDQIQTLQKQSDDATAEIQRLSNEVPEVAEAPVDVPKLEGPAEAPVNTLDDITPNKVANSPVEASVVSEVDNPATGNMKVSKTRSNTLEKSGLLTEAELDQKFSPDKFMYEEISEKESMLEGARLRQAEGDAFVQNRLNKEGFTSADTDGMMQAYADKVAEARALEAAGENSDDLWDEANTIFRKIQREGTRGGQAIEALKKWSRNTPEGIMMEAERVANSRLTKRNGKDYVAKNVRDKLAKAADAKAVKKNEALFSSFTSRLRQSIDVSGYGGNNLAIKNLYKAIDKFDNAVKKGDIGEIKEAYGAITGRIKRMGKKGLTNDTSLSEVKEAIDNLAKTSRVEGFTFSPEFQRQFIEEASKLQDLDPDSREFKEAYARLGKQVGEEIRRNTPGRKRAVQMLTTYLMDNMLGNFRTLITRNAGGNVGLNLLEQTVTRPLAAALDRLVSLKTGKRTQAGLSREALADYLSGFFKGIKEEAQDLKSGLHTARSGEVNIKNAIDNNGHIFATDKKIFKPISWIADKADGLVRHGLAAGDRPFYESVYNQTIGDLNRFRAKGLLGEEVQALSDADFKQLAEATAQINALTAVYQNDSLMSDALLGFKQSISQLSQGALGFDALSQFTMPFVKTPANVIDRAIDYSPLGLVRNTVKTIGEGGINGPGFNQNRFVNETARNIIGTGLMGGAGIAAKNKLITGKLSDDPDEKQAQRNRGMQEYALDIPKLGENGVEQNVDISWVPVLGSNAVAAAAAVNAMNDPKISPVDKALAGMEAGGQALISQAVFQGLQRLFGQGDSYNSDAGIVGNMLNTVKQGATQFVPSLARQAAQVADPLQRDLSNGNYDVNTIKNTIPGLRETLQPRVDSEGNYMQENQGRSIGSKILEDMFLPGKITEIKDIPLDTEAQRLQALTGENKSYQPKAKISEITTDDHTPTPEEYTQYQVDRNHAMTTVGNKLINTEYYKSLSPTDQEEILSKAYSGVKDYMQSQYTDHELATAAGKAYAQNGSDGAVGKLVTDKLMDDNNISKGSRFAKQVNEIVNSGNVDGAKELIDLYNDVKKKATTKDKSGEDYQKKADLMREILALPKDKQAAMYDAFGNVCSTDKEKAAYEKGGAEAAINEYRRATAEDKRKAAEKAVKRKEDATEAGVSVTQLDTLQKQLADAGAINSPDTVKYYNHARQTIPSLTVKEYTDNVRRIGGADMKVSQKDMLNYLNTNNVGAEEGMKYWNTYISGKKLPRLTNGKWTSYTPK